MTRHHLADVQVSLLVLYLRSLSLEVILLFSLPHHPTIRTNSVVLHPVLAATKYRSSCYHDLLIVPFLRFIFTLLNVG